MRGYVIDVTKNGEEYHNELIRKHFQDYRATLVKPCYRRHPNHVRGRTGGPKKKPCQSWTPSDKTFWIRACKCFEIYQTHEYN